MENLNLWSKGLKQNKQKILESWAAASRRSIPAAKNLEQYALLNSMPLVIDALINLLSEPIVHDQLRKLEHDLACVHGLARAQNRGFTPRDIDQEYRLLRDIIFNVLNEQFAPVPPQMAETIGNSIDIASHSAQQTLMRAEAVREKSVPAEWHLSESRYRMIVEEVEEYAIFMIDLTGHVASWNKGTFKIKGYEPQEIIGQPFRTLFTEEDAALGRPEWELEYAVKHGRYSGEGWRKKKDGSRFWAAVVLTPLRNEEGELVGWCKITRDMTTEKHAEEELRKAEEATRAKSVFLANMSHEIRTPLGVIMGFADLLLEPGLNYQEKAEYSETIRRNGEQLVALIDGILDLSKVEAGKQIVEKSSFSLSDLLDDVYKTLHHKALDKGLRFEIESHTGVVDKIYSDRSRLRQILINLIGNAIKFTDAGYVKVEVETRMGSEPSIENNLRFLISDSGIGISPEYQKRLFQAFTQAHATKSRIFGGTGLGLALSRELARALGGDLILVESRAGNGSTFLVSVDAGVGDRVTWIEDPSGKVPPYLRADLPLEEAHRLDGTHILLAENSPDNQKLISSFLKSAGAEVEIVENGSDAVRAAETGTFDLILMDIQMPEMDGYEATRLLRQSQCDLPIVALTALAMKEERERSQALGFDEYLTKPINRSALLKTLNHLIQKRYTAITERALHLQENRSEANKSFH